MENNSTLSDALNLLELVRDDARSNLEHKRGSVWANELIFAFARAIEKFIACEEFYLKGKMMPIKDLFAAFLEKRGELLGILEWAAEVCSYARPIPHSGEIEVLNFVAGLFCQLLEQIPEIESEQFAVNEFSWTYEKILAAAHDGSEGNCFEMAESMRDYLFNIAEAAYHIRLHEFRIWYEHQEWMPELGEWSPSGPFNGRESYNNLYLALKDFDAKYGACFSWLNNGIGALKSPYLDAPVAFLRKDRPYTYAHVAWRSVRAVLVQPVSVEFSHSDELAAVLGFAHEEFVPSKFLLERRRTFLIKMKAYLRSRASKQPPGSETRRLWLEAAAEFLSNISLHQAIFSEEQADRILALANRAQRECWIVERLNKKSTGEEIERPGVRVVPSDETGKVAARGERFAEALTYVVNYMEGRSAPKPAKKGRLRPTTKARGTKNKTMARQLKRFFKWVKEGHAIDESARARRVGARAEQFWNENAAEFERAAAESGDQRGYLNAKTLADAARKALRK